MTWNGSRRSSSVPSLKDNPNIYPFFLLSLSCWSDSRGSGRKEGSEGFWKKGAATHRLRPGPRVFCSSYRNGVGCDCSFASVVSCCEVKSRVKHQLTSFEPAQGFLAERRVLRASAASNRSEGFCSSCRKGVGCEIIPLGHLSAIDHKAE